PPTALHARAARAHPLRRRLPPRRDRLLQHAALLADAARAPRRAHLRKGGRPLRISRPPVAGQLAARAHLPPPAPAPRPRRPPRRHVRVLPCPPRLTPPRRPRLVAGPCGWAWRWWSPSTSPIRRSASPRPSSGATTATTAPPTCSARA